MVTLSWLVACGAADVNLQTMLASRTGVKLVMQHRYRYDDNMVSVLVAFGCYDDNMVNVLVAFWVCKPERYSS